MDKNCKLPIAAAIETLKEIGQLRKSLFHPDGKQTLSIFLLNVYNLSPSSQQMYNTDRPLLFFTTTFALYKKDLEL